MPDGDIHLCSSTYFVRLPLTRELSSESETEGETEFLQHPKRAIFSLSLRLFAAQKSTSLVRGRLAPAAGLCVICGAMGPPQAFPFKGKVARLYAATDEVENGFIPCRMEIYICVLVHILSGSL